MAENSKIEWTDHTFNPWTGCTKVSPGCDRCYAESWAKRSGTVDWGQGEPRRRTTEQNWRKPLAWNKAHEQFFAEHGRRQRVFCASLADVFDNEAPAEWRARLFALIAATPSLDWLLLTKRIGNVARMIEAPGMQKCGLPANVWLGATVVNQEEADRDIPKLLAVPARVRFLSIEPMLGPIRLDGHETSLALGLGQGTDWLTGHTSQCSSIFGGDTEPWNSRADYEFPADAKEPHIHWVICGGESGPHARPMHPDWARSLRDQCAAAGVPFLFKQWGEWICAGELRRMSGGGMPGFGAFDHCRHNMSTDTVRVGKKAAGRLLDGVTHDEFPKVQQ